jgi:hypothetical protein
MSTVDSLLERYKAEHRALGYADPAPYLERVDGLDRAELIAHIDRYLARIPQRAFDAAAYAQFRADPNRAQRVASALDDTTLRDLVQASGVRRVELSQRLAARLGLPGLEQKVRGRLRDIENGDVQLHRVRPNVWEALGEVIGQSADRVRRAAENVATAHDAGEMVGLSLARSGPAAVDALLEVAGSAPPRKDTEDDRQVDEAFFID